MKITKTELKQIIKEELKTALEGPEDPRTEEAVKAVKAVLQAALGAFYETHPDPDFATADMLEVVEKFLSAKIGMPIELRY